MEQEEKKRFNKKFIIGICIYAILFLLVVSIVNLEQINGWVSSILKLLRPILIGLAVAYLCNPFFRFFERKVFFGVRPPSLRRTISLLCSYLTLLLIVAMVLLLILPQLIESLSQFIFNYNTHVSDAIAQANKLVDWVNSAVEPLLGNKALLTPLDETTIRASAANFFSNFNSQTNGIGGLLEKLDLNMLSTILGNTVSVLADSLFGIFISVYLLSTKEKRYAQVMKLRHALFSDTVNARITQFCTTADRSFGGFLEGKLIDSLIIGILTYLVIICFHIPYAPLIATFVGITNIVPVVGPFIGAIPTAFILLLSDPSKVIPFLIIIVVIQQIDGNIIGPKILGSNTGVSTLCVVIAICTVGRLWGLFGMILAVPLFATALEMIDNITVAFLQKKGMPSGIENYYDNDSVVDPVKDSHPNTDKTVQRSDRRATYIRIKQQSGEKLNRRERFELFVNDLMHKYHIVTPITEEENARYFAEDAERRARSDAESYLKTLEAPEASQQNCQETQPAAVESEPTDSTVEHDSESVTAQSDINRDQTESE